MTDEHHEDLFVKGENQHGEPIQLPINRFFNIISNAKLGGEQRSFLCTGKYL